MSIEGLFTPTPLKKGSKGIKLKLAYFFSQKNNKNPDGTDNMAPRGSSIQKRWGRFNHCFISTTVAVYNQAVEMILSLGYACRISNPFQNEHDTLLALNYPNKRLWPKPNRFLWENHRQFFKVCLAAVFPDLKFDIFFKQTKDNWKEDVRKSLEAGFQCYISFNNPDHVLSVIGEENGGFWVCDPAGDIRKGYSDLTNTDGKDIFYDSKIIDEHVTEDKHYMVLRLK